jgi:epoxyqueuosine reductase
MSSLEELLNIENLAPYGIVDFGYTTESIPKSYKKYSDWVDRDHHEPLGYLSGERKEKRDDLRKYFPEFKSALVFLFSYQASKLEQDQFYKSMDSNGLKIASYVLGFDGIDYHHRVRADLQKIADQLKSTRPGLEVVQALDIQPVLDRDLAFRAGLGWYGKNSMFINRDKGSFTIIGSLLLSSELDLKKKALETDHCGQCTACVEACPTDAIDLENRTIITNKCISTYTIEIFKDNAMEPPPGMENGQGEIFGCDICQDVCPWNLRLSRGLKKVKRLELKDESILKKVTEFFLKRPKEQLVKELEGMSNSGYKREFKGTPLERTGRVGILKNIKFQLQKKES